MDSLPGCRRWTVRAAAASMLSAHSALGYCAALSRPCLPCWRLADSRVPSPSGTALPAVERFDLRRDEADRQSVHFSVVCSKGTYIRSLAADLGRALGTAAHLTALRREAIGEYSVQGAWEVPDLADQVHQLRLQQKQQEEQQQGAAGTGVAASGNGQAAAEAAAVQQTAAAAHKDT